MVWVVVECQICSGREARLALSVEDDFMVFDQKPTWCQRVHIVQTTRQIKNPVASIAEKKVVMVPGGAFVVGCDAGDIDESHAALFDELFDCAVNGGDPERGDFLFR